MRRANLEEQNFTRDIVSELKKGDMVSTENALWQRYLQLRNGTHSLEGRVHVTCVAHVNKTNWIRELHDI